MLSNPPNNIEHDMKQYHFNSNIQPYTPFGQQQQSFFFPVAMQTEEEAKYNSLKDCLNYILSKDFIADFFPNAFDQLHDSQEVFVDMKELMNVPIVENITNDLNMIMKALKENKKIFS